MKKENIPYIIAGAIILFFLIKNNGSKGKISVPLVECSKHTCGGFPSTSGIAPQCPEGCECGAGDPFIPDAPRTCVKIR